MDMLVMGLCFTFFCLAVCAAVFAAATRTEAPAEQAQPEVPALQPAAPARFFADRVTPNVPATMPIPVELLLQQLENHIRLEQAAAESFVAYPSQARLHSKTTSSFVN